MMRILSLLLPLLKWVGVRLAEYILGLAIISATVLLGISAVLKSRPGIS